MPPEGRSFYHKPWIWQRDDQMDKPPIREHKSRNGS